MRLRLLFAAGITTGLLFAPASPAQAAVPKRKPTDKYTCPGEPGKTARVWTKADKGVLTKLAVDNDCSSFMAFGYGTYANGDPRNELLVAPGTHFNWNQKRLQYLQNAGFAVTIGSVHWHSEAACQASTSVILVYGYNDIREPEGESC